MSAYHTGIHQDCRHLASRLDRINARLAVAVGLALLQSAALVTLAVVWSWGA